MTASLKGALVTFLPGSRLPSIVNFPLNPESITHALTTAAGALLETYQFTLMLDAEMIAGTAADVVQTQLSAFEALLSAGAVLFAWGRGNYVAVRINALNITEKSFDAELNVTQAEVEITLLALTNPEMAALQEPMAGLATAAYNQRTALQIAALQQAQIVADPEQSSAGGLL